MCTGRPSQGQAGQKTGARTLSEAVQILVYEEVPKFTKPNNFQGGHHNTRLQVALRPVQICLTNQSSIPGQGSPRSEAAAAVWEICKEEPGIPHHSLAANSFIALSKSFNFSDSISPSAKWG